MQNPSLSKSLPGKEQDAAVPDAVLVEFEKWQDRK